VAAYDASRPLVIDPVVLSYSTYLGGSGDDQGFGIAVDTDGNAYVTGRTDSANFPTISGAFQPTGGSTTDAFVTKLNPAGSALVYSTYIGGSGFDSGAGIAVDAAGNAYVTGFTGSTNFPTTAGAFQTTFANGANFGGDAFVTKLDPTGSTLVYSTYLGGDSDDQGFGIAVDTNSNAYITGYTLSANFPTTPGAFQRIFVSGSIGDADAFVTKLDPTGSAQIYSTYLGGSAYDGGSGIAVDAASNAYVTGITRSTNFPTTGGAFQTAFASTSDFNADAFVTKLDSTGSSLVYSTYLGGGSDEAGAGIAVDASGSAYVTGRTNSFVFPTTPGAFQPVGFSNGLYDAFVTKLDPAGSALVYSTRLGGSANDVGSGIVVDTDGNAYVVGSTFSDNFPTTPGAFQPIHAGGWDVFVTKLHLTGSLLYSTYLGGSGPFPEHGGGLDEGQGIAVDTAGNAYVTGRTISGNFPTTPGAFQPTRGGGIYDAFVAKIVEVLPLPPVVVPPLPPILGL